MTKICNPKQFSDYFGVPPDRLKRLGVLDPTLNADTRLFVDPMLLPSSRHSEMANDARKTYEQHFVKVIKFLRATKTPGNVAWRTAQKFLSFPEIKWTCLGYGAGSVSGSGSGNEMTTNYIETARQIVELGVDDPDLFVAMALFEEGVGPDRISDMATNVIFGDLLRFSERVLNELKVPVQETEIQLRNGQRFTASLPVNPYLRDAEPIVLVPSDVLRDLPIATDWADIADAASKNQQLRDRVNREISELWEVKSRKDKVKLRRWAMSGKKEFETFLDMVREADALPYDGARDPQGELTWRKIAAALAEDVPFHITVPPRMDVGGVVAIVEQIIEQFRFLIEKRRLSVELYSDNVPRPEKSAQRLFFAVAHAYCRANNLDLTPEADTGNGPVDFKVSNSFKGRVLVEIKLSRNGKLVDGYTRQLEAYKFAEQTTKAYYLVIDVGNMGKKDEKLISLRNQAVAKGDDPSKIEFVDGIRRLSASKL